MAHRNYLDSEKSPYLLQHRDNPVWWFPWGEKAFEAASQESKPIFLSVGYSTCHWCHVMEKDSFEKQDVAELLNGNFISIKIDREERPDIDAIYMDAVVAVSGHGGWPMTCLLTSEGVPFWAGTFLSHDALISLLTRVADLWKNNRERLVQGSNEIVQYLRQSTQARSNHSHAVTPEFLGRFGKIFEEGFDHHHGGLKGAPKFPQTLSLMTLLRTRGCDLVVSRTLDQMRRGGIYDQVGFGFHRYSTDDHWEIPHFEKMLCDNALLARTYLEAFQTCGNPEYRRTTEEVFSYVLDKMRSPEGAFYSAEDADSEGIEGKFYVWDPYEIEKTLTREENEVIKGAFSISPSSRPGFSAHRTGDEVTDKRHGPPELVGHVPYLKPDSHLPQSPLYESARRKLFSLRERRVRPHLDDKIIVSWNSLMISALTMGYQALGSTEYLDAAAKAAHFIKEKMVNQDGKLLRVGSIPAMSEDYAFFTQALLDLHESTLDSAWYDKALELQKKQDELFWDDKQGGYYENDGGDPNLFLRSKNFEDGVIPSANSISALNLLRIYHLSTDAQHRARAEKIFKAASEVLSHHPQTSAAMLIALDFYFGKVKEIVIAGPLDSPQAARFLAELRKKFEPRKILAHGRIPIAANKPSLTGKTTFYVCENQTCRTPTTDVEKALQYAATCM